MSSLGSPSSRSRYRPVAAAVRPRVLTTSALLVVLALAGCASAADVADEAAGTSTTSEPAPTEPSPSTEPTEPTVPSEPTAPTEPPEPPEPELASRPEVGNCYAVKNRDFLRQRDGSFPVKCREPHTAETYAVFRVDPYPVSPQIDGIWRKCHDRFRAYVGASENVSKLGVALIMPGTRQVIEGQGWIRCDVIERVNFNGQVGLERTGSVRNVLADGVPKRFRGCVRHWPRPNKAVHFTSCDVSHQAELIPEAIRIGGPRAPFPGVGVTRQRSQTFCENTVLDYVPEALNYYYYFPTRASWRAGTRDTVCWALDKDGQGLPAL
jgi:hypothetical protein